LNFYFLIS